MASCTIMRALLCLGICAGAAAQQTVVIHAGGGANASGNAVRVLERELRNHGWIPRRAATAPPGDLLLTFSTGLPGRPESFSIHKTPGSIAVRGAGDTGLAYGAYELLGQWEAGGWPANLSEPVSDTDRSPDVNIRSLAMSLFNRDLEREWYFSREFWEHYFELLAKSRFNQFTLIFGHQTSYFAPPFPFMVDVPGYEHLKTPDYSPEDRRRNLAALRMISELADQWGVPFVLGIWLEQANGYGPNLVQGLSYQDLFDYCPKALAILLRECPKISGVQFRANSESGILEDDQNRFFTGIARAIRSVARPVWTDIRAKGLRAETIASLQHLGIRPTVSTKYWREHMGLPFHGTRIDPFDKERSYRRYGYWDLLPHDRPYDVLYEMWTFGSQKILLWGSLDYARRFAASTHLGAAEGFEVFAPLSQKGFGNWSGGPWHIFADRSSEYYGWEFERYWAYYLAFGLGGYAPQAPQPLLDGEFRQRFGNAAPEIRKAYEAASWIIPFLTAVRNPSSSNFHYWPEMDTGGLTDRYIQLDTGDNNLFYRIDEYVGDYLKRHDSARLTPDQMSARLDAWAGAARQAVQRAQSLFSSGRNAKEFNATRLDFEVLAALARYHAERLRSAENYQFFRRSGERQYLLGAIQHYRSAVSHWASLAKLTDGIYYEHMVFNRPPDQVGHWKDELPFLEADLARLQQIDSIYLENCVHPEQARTWRIPMPRAKMMMQWKEEGGVPKRWADTTLTPEKASEGPGVYSVENPRYAVGKLFSDFRYSRILHVPVRRALAGSPIYIHASLLEKRQGVPLILYYRLAGRGFRFSPLPMTEQELNIFRAAIPAARAGATVFYYIQATAQTSFFSGSEKEPHAIVVTGPGSVKPDIRHVDILKARAGAEVRVRADVASPLPAAAVRLYYRHLDQSEDWNVAEMANIGDGVYEAAIPGEFVVPGWDLSYLIEAVNISGAGAFYPDFQSRQPFVVVPVASY